MASQDTMVKILTGGDYRKPLDFTVQYIGLSSTNFDDKEVLVLHDDEKDIQRWNALNIYEDIFRNFMSCEIAILDQDGEFLDKLRTEEIITVKFKTPGLNPRTHQFYLYKISPIIPLDKIMGAQYVIHGISVEFFYNTLRAFSKSYSGKTEEIVKQIYEEFLESKTGALKKKLHFGNPDSSATKHEMKFSFPYINPVEAINHMASVSVNNSNPFACNYIFYENRDGFWFTCLEEIFKNPTWSGEGANRREHSYTSQQTLIESFLNLGVHFNKTIRVDPQSTGDKIVDTMDGVYGEYFSEFDLLYKQYKPFVNPDGKGTDYLEVKAEGQRYLDYFEKTAHAESGLKPLISKENQIFHYPLGRNRVCFTNGALYSDPEPFLLSKDDSVFWDVESKSWRYTNYPGRVVEKWKLYDTHEGEYSFLRRSQMQQINLFTVQISVPGNTDITVGDCCTLDAPIYRSGSGVFLGGKYLVIAVAHKLLATGFESILTLARDGVKPKDFQTNEQGGQ